MVEQVILLWDRDVVDFSYTTNTATLKPRRSLGMNAVLWLDLAYFGRYALQNIFSDCSEWIGNNMKR